MNSSMLSKTSGGRWAMVQSSERPLYNRCNAVWARLLGCVTFVCGVSFLGMSWVHSGLGRLNWVY